MLLAEGFTLEIGPTLAGLVILITQTGISFLTFIQARKTHKAVNSTATALADQKLLDDAERMRLMKENSVLLAKIVEMTR